MTRGAHTVVLGGLYMNFHKQQDLFGQTNGNFNFNGSYTGLGYADFLPGRAFQYTELQNQYSPNYITHSLQSSIRTERYRGLTLQASYTWSHSLDYASGDVPGNNHQDAYSWGLEHANSNFDRRHMLIFSYVYDIPLLFGRGLVRQVFGNWQFSGISA